MKRIDIHYGGQVYSIGNRDVDTLRSEIVDGLDAGPVWLTVNDGEGSARAAHLLIAPGIPIALVPVPDPDSESASDAGSDSGSGSA